jgi:hypothetical protein
MMLVFCLQIWLSVLLGQKIQSSYVQRHQAIRLHINFSFIKEEAVKKTIAYGSWQRFAHFENQFSKL